MRCEICNKSMTYLNYDGSGETHWYCQHCEDAIEEASAELDDDKDEWFLEDLVYLEELEGYDVGDEEGDVPYQDSVSDWDEDAPKARPG